MSNIVVFDGGNAINKIKAYHGESVLPHALKRISQTTYEEALMRGGDSITDYLKINDHYYVVGERAFTEGFRGRQTGSARYTADYYGVLLAASLFRLYDKNIRNITLYASHAPQDVNYRDDLKAAALGVWSVEHRDTVRTFEVKAVHCGDEPVWGLYNDLLNQNGTGYRQGTTARSGETLVIDIGGHTTDVVVMDNGRVDYSTADSIEDGVIRVEKDFARQLVSRYRDEFRKSSAPKPNRLRDALRVGRYKAGGFGDLPCEGEVQRATELLVRAIEDLYIQYGATAAYDNLLLTGGGAGLLEHQLKERLGHPNTIMADKPADIHLANVRGGWKMMRFYQAKGLLT